MEQSIKEKIYADVVFFEYFCWNTYMTMQEFYELKKYILQSSIENVTIEQLVLLLEQSSYRCSSYRQPNKLNIVPTISLINNYREELLSNERYQKWACNIKDENQKIQIMHNFHVIANRLIRLKSDHNFDDFVIDMFEEIILPITLLTYRDIDRFIHPTEIYDCIINTTVKKLNENKSYYQEKYESNENEIWDEYLKDIKTINNEKNALYFKFSINKITKSNDIFKIKIDKLKNLLK
jgi:hypothetical protein